MDRHLKSLVTLAKAIFAGFMVLTVLTIAIFFVGLILNTTVPSQPVDGMGITLPAGLGRAIATYAVLYFLSTCVASFIAGFLLKRWDEGASSYAWQSLVGGFIIGASGPFLLLFVVSNKPFFASDVILNFTLGLPGTLSGLIGYYVANRKYRRLASE